MSDYPSEEELARIREWPATDPLGWFAFIGSIWWNSDWGWSGPGEIVYDDVPFQRLDASTSGWSGNEEIVNAMADNYILWSLTWYSMRRGGHYEFHIPLKEKP